MNNFKNKTNIGNLSQNQRSLFQHETKVEVLKTISDLIGCTKTFPLADGIAPDVVRINASQTLLFVGDAKETESPKNKQTKIRLYNYLLWIRAYILKPNRSSIFAICFRDISDYSRWVISIQELIKIVDIDFSSFKLTQIDQEINLLYFNFHS